MTSDTRSVIEKASPGPRVCACPSGSGDSRILMYRDIRERAVKAAPFLSFDGDPYSVVVDGRIKWVLDAFTRTGTFPYSETVQFDQPDFDPVTKGLTGSANYLRNSVKVVVDAFDGDVTYYVVDESDPIVQVWRNAFPDLFRSGVGGDVVILRLTAHPQVADTAAGPQRNVSGRLQLLHDVRRKFASGIV